VLRKILISLGSLAFLIVVLMVALFAWVKNPYDLESERLGPKGNEALPEVSIEPDSKNYLLYEGYDHNLYAIHLALPNHYIHESNVTKRISKSYGAYVTMYYPNMNGKYHPDNAHIPKCNGWCSGYMRASIKPASRKAIDINERKIERLAKERKEHSHLRHFQDLEQEFGLDNHFQIRYPAIEKKSKDKKNSTDEYFIKHADDGSAEYLFQCSPYVPSPSCSVKFNLSSMPELLVDITFSRSLMDDWKNIIRMADSRISSWKLKKIKLAEG